MDNFSKLILAYNPIVSLVLFVISFIYLIHICFKKHQVSHFLLLLVLIISLGGIAINQTPSEAYLPIIFPFVIFLFAIFMELLLSKIQIFYLLFVVILIINSYFSWVLDFKNDLSYRLAAANKIIALTKTQEYNLIGKGDASQFESFTMNYEYLLWWKGHPASNKNQKTKIIIKEENGQIIVSKSSY